MQGLTDSATKAADQLLNAAQTPEAFNAAIGAMQKDMQNVTANQVKQIGSVSGTVAKFLAKANGQEMPATGGGVTPPPGAKVEKWVIDPATGKLVKGGG